MRPLSHIALSAPIDVTSIADRLPAGVGDLPEGLGGTPTSQLVGGLLDCGYFVTVVTLDRHIREEVTVDGDRLRLRIGPYRPRHRAHDAFRAERRFLRRALEEEKPDVVHAHWSYEFALGALASKCPTLVTVRDWAPTILRHHPHPYRMVRFGMHAAVLAKGRHFTVASPYMQTFVERWTRTKVPIIPNALDDAMFRPPRRRPMPDGPTLLGINTGFSRRKNVGVLLLAFKRLREALPTVRLQLLGGDFGEGEAAQVWAQERDLIDGVQFLGKVPYRMVAEHLAGADLFVHSSLEESFGMVAVEAMAHGVPVIAGDDSGALPWVLDGGAAGVLTDVRSPVKLAETMQGLLEDHDRWQKLREASYARAWDRFRLTVVLDDYVAAYDRTRSMSGK